MWGATTSGLGREQGIKGLGFCQILIFCKYQNTKRSLSFKQPTYSRATYSVLGSVGTQPAGQVVSRLYQQKLSILVTNTASHRGKNSVYRLDAVCGENREFGI